MKSNIINRYSNIELYIKYEMLELKDLAHLFRHIDDLYNNVLNTFRLDKVWDDFRNGPIIESINTGNSIKIVFTENWIPKTRIYKKELQIDIPRNIGIIAIVLYALAVTAEKYYVIRNAALDMQIKQLEVELKQIDVDNSRRKEISQNRETVESVRKNHDITYPSDRALNVLFENPNFYFVLLNGTILKDTVKMP